MPERVTSLDVARRAGVSQSAVSRVYTPGASASTETTRKVLAAAEALGYRPNVLARSLITGRSRIIGLVVAHLENHFYPKVVEQLSKALQARGYHVLVFMTGQKAGDIDAVLEGILDYQVDGLVIASAELSSDLAARCQATGVPVVLFNRKQDDDGVSSVTSDNRAGGRAIAAFLAAGGHRRPAYIAGWDGASTQRDREAGFREGLGAAGLEVHARAVGDFDPARAATVTRALFARDAPPDAIFAANDLMAIAVMDVLREELGLRVPEDVSVVGFDDVPPAAWRAYALTTYRQDPHDMVTETVTTLMTAIEDGRTDPRQVVVPGRLIVRSSARIPPDSERPIA